MSLDVPDPPLDVGADFNSRIPNDVRQKLARGRKVMLKDASKRRLCMRFRDGDSYHYIDSKNFVQGQSLTTSPDGSGKPNHRIRNRYDFIGPIIDNKVSQATATIPSYETNPSSRDSERISAAKLAEQIAIFGYDQWRVRNATEKASDLAIGGGGVSYTMPYFDPNVGPYSQMADGTWVGEGDIKLKVLNGNQVYSEPGVDFDDSPWYAIEEAMPIDTVKEMPGFIPGTVLKPDANASDVPTDRDPSDNLTMVVQFFERPCPKWPQGRSMVYAANRPVTDERLIDPSAPFPWGSYPLVDHDGSILDEPLLHRLVYRVNAEKDRDLGLTWQLIDFERTIQDCYNKLLEWKNRCLNPQMLAPVGSLMDRPNDIPGATRYFRPVGGQVPQWENVPTAWAGPLFQILDRAVNDMRAVAADDQFTADPNVAAATINAVQGSNTSRWDSFLKRLAEWHSRVMRHCLVLVARHYTEPRLLQIRGRLGPENIDDFLGAHLLGQTSVTVQPGSLVAKTRSGIQQELSWIQANWPGYISPEVAIAALNSGTSANLINSFEFDLNRVNEVIQKIQDGTVLDMPPRQEEAPQIGPYGPLVDPNTGAPVMGQVEVGSYMPSANDSIPIWERTFGDWMKTDSFIYAPVEMQDVANQIWKAIQWQKTQQAQAAQNALNAQAAQLGTNNAAAPQVKGVPSQPGVSAPATPGAPPAQ